MNTPQSSFWQNVEKPDLGNEASIRQFLLSFLVFFVGADPDTASRRDWFYALAYLLRGELNRRAIESQRIQKVNGAKQVYYLSMEYLPGRSLLKNLIDLGIQERVAKILADLGQDLDEVAQLEFDAALGNGGLGRLAACFMDAMATHRYPGVGYGLRYEFGMFNQAIENGEQVEHPEGWLRYGNPWEFERPSVIYPVGFHGYVVDGGRDGRKWLNADIIIAMAFDTHIAGYNSPTVMNQRLWAARADRDFDLEEFNRGDYIDAVREKTISESLSKVLYPNDATAVGQELRLKQEYFFVSASLQDIVRNYRLDQESFDLFPSRVAIQLNDTHPAQAVSELMRILVDDHGCNWKSAWEITKRTFSYTNHTLLPEALETWPIGMMESVLPRHLEIIYRINEEFLRGVRKAHPGDEKTVGKVSLVDDEQQRVRMAHLAIVGSHKVNGVAELHTELLRTRTFADFDRLFPGRFINVTNGITPRRWLRQANPQLSALVSEHIGEGWLTDLAQLKDLLPLADDTDFRQRFMAAKRANKERFARQIHQRFGIRVDPDSMFDVQVKRIHEYKRQLLNVLHVLTRYNRFLEDPAADLHPRTMIFAGKAAPGYYMAKLIVRLINDVAKLINNDANIGERLKVVFVPNYNVSVAEMVMPGCDLSEQISTAGTEASGTGNMKLALNGALTIGTLDGANIEILQEVGEDNMYVFGLKAEEVDALRGQGYDPRQTCEDNLELKRVIDMIAEGVVSPEEPERYRPLVDALLEGGDHFLVLADYADYVACQERVDADYRRQDDWARRAILNVANIGKFSSDRTIHHYARDIWDITQAG